MTNTEQHRPQVAPMHKHRPEHLYPVRAERAVITQIISRGVEALSIATGLLRLDDFCDEQCLAAFRGLLGLEDAGRLRAAESISVLALWDAIQASGGGPAFARGPENLRDLFLDDELAFAGGEDGPRQAALLVSRASMMRLATSKAETLIQSIRSHSEIDGRLLVEGAAAELVDIAGRAMSSEGAMHISVVCDEHDRVMQGRLEGRANTVSYGISALDSKTDGADASVGEMVGLLARPSMGKTAMLGAIVRGQNVYRRDWQTPVIRDPHHWQRLWGPLDTPNPTLIASIEMSPVKLLDRQCGDMCSIDTRILHRPIRDNVPGDRERWDSLAPLVRGAKQFIRGWPVEYVRQPRYIEEIERQAKVWRRSHPVIGYDAQGKPVQGPASILVDHLGILRMLAGMPKGMNKTEYVGQIVQRLKDLGVDLKVVVFLLIQLNRGDEGRDDPRPQLSDGRDSGNIEEIIDTGIGLFRPCYYGSGDNSEDEIWEQYYRLVQMQSPAKEILAAEAKATHMEAIIRKARNGSTGTAVLGFYRKYTRIVDKVRIPS